VFPALQVKRLQRAFDSYFAAHELQQELPPGNRVPFGDYAVGGTRDGRLRVLWLNFPALRRLVDVRLDMFVLETRMRRIDSKSAGLDITWACRADLIRPPAPCVRLSAPTAPLTTPTKLD